MALSSLEPIGVAAEANQGSDEREMRWNVEVQAGVPLK